MKSDPCLGWDDLALLSCQSLQMNDTFREASVKILAESFGKSDKRILKVTWKNKPSQTAP